MLSQNIDLPGSKGLPLGNLTSQWFANIYLHELDWWVKNKLKIKYYMRYNDDVIIISTNKNQMRIWTKKIQNFVSIKLDLHIPNRKVKTIGLPKMVDILGVCTDGYRTWIRLKTKKEAYKKLFEKQWYFKEEFFDSLSSY